MSINYKEEYFLLIKDIRYKLSKIYLKKNIANKYQKLLNDIASFLDSKSEAEDYYKAFTEASKIESELTKIINNHKELVLPPYETSNYLKERIKVVKKGINEKIQKNQNLGIKLVTYALTGSIFITAGAYTIVRDKTIPHEKLYLTTETTYNDYSDSTKYKYDYEKENDGINRVIIKETTPWVPGVKEATRYKRSYYIDNFTYDEIINSKDYESIIANLEYEELIDTMPMDAYNGIKKYDNSLFEVIEIHQDKNNYQEKKRLVSSETLGILFTELLVYMMVISFNKELLIESILKTIKNININNKIISYNESTLKLLKQQTKKKTRKK